MTEPLSCPILRSIGTQLPAQLMCAELSMSNVETLVFDSPKTMLLCYGIPLWIVADNMQKYGESSSVH